MCKIILHLFKRRIKDSVYTLTIILPIFKKTCISGLYKDVIFREYVFKDRGKLEISLGYSVSPLWQGKKFAFQVSPR